MVSRRALIEAGDWRKVPDHNLHMTLVFLGNQPACRQTDIAAAVKQTRRSAGTIVLDRFGWFPGSQVLWFGGEAGADLVALHARLRQALGDYGLQTDRRPYRPHVTLYRRVSSRPVISQPEPLVWMPQELALMQSVAGQPYRVLEFWPLQG